MAAISLSQFFIGIFVALGMDIFAVTNTYNQVTNYIYTSGMGISQYDSGVLLIIMYAILGIPLFAIIFGIIDTYNTITFRTE